MKNTIIPEIVKNEISSPTETNQPTLNLQLNQTIDRRTNNNNQTYNHTTNNTYNKSGGFFSFIFSIITIPFKIIYFLWTYLEKKFNIKQTLKKEKETLARSKWIKKYFISTKNVYKFDEVF